MAHLVIESFANGLDLRKLPDAAVPGSLRVLSNAFVDEGGVIVKRKAFAKHTNLTAYAQAANYRGKVTGPHQVASQESVIFFRHRHNSLPGGVWGTGSASGTEAAHLTLNGANEQPMTAWAMRSTIGQDNPDGLMHVTSIAYFATYSYLVETYFDNNIARQAEFVKIEHASSGEPLTEAEVTANEDRRYQLTLKSKGYVINNGNTLFASATGDPGDMASTGSGSVDVRTQGIPIGRLIALSEYFGNLAVFGRRGVQFWSVSATFASNQYLRSIPAQVLAARSVTPYAYGDILYLADNGIRSLRARDSSNEAHVSDVGSPIDSLIRGVLNWETSTLEGVWDDQSDEVRNAYFDINIPIGIVHPQTGQFWLCLREKVYVLSVNPDAKVRAWSTFDLPTAVEGPDPDFDLEKHSWVADICQIRSDIAFRNFADEVFLYGGTSGDDYDASLAEVVTPYFDMGRPSSAKQIHGIDVACEGTWSVEISTDVTSEAWQMIGTITGSSHRVALFLPCEMEVTHFSLRLRSTSALEAKIGQLSIMYDGLPEK